MHSLDILAATTITVSAGFSLQFKDKEFTTIPNSTVAALRLKGMLTKFSSLWHLM